MIPPDFNDRTPEWMQINTDDFNTMRSMLSEIEMKIMQLGPYHQRQFYAPIQAMILEAWLDACNQNDSFLYNNPNAATPNQ